MEVKFKDRVLKVYGDLDKPLFKAADVADLRRMRKVTARRS